MTAKEQPKERKRLQVDLDRSLQVKLEMLRKAYNLTSQTEALRLAIAMAVRTAEDPGKPSVDAAESPSGGDPLNVEADFEGSLRLARLSRRRFYRNPGPETLKRWGELLAEIVNLEPLDYENKEQLDVELSRFREAKASSLSKANPRSKSASPELDQAAELAWRDIPGDVQLKIRREITALGVLASG